MIPNFPGEQKYSRTRIPSDDGLTSACQPGLSQNKMESTLRWRSPEEESTSHLLQMPQKSGQPVHVHSGRYPRHATEMA